MAKYIKTTPEQIAECRAAFEKILSEGKFPDGKITFTKAIGQSDAKANVFFSEIAWIKMITLLQEFDKEVAWHATASRIEKEDDEHKDEKNDYYISDILVYPQEVTATTVEMDTEKYAKWLMDNIEDDRFNHIHAQMHSHVNMGVTPSAVDITHQEEILAQLSDTNFYIFMIWNKKLEANIRIFDMRKNLMFESRDVTWSVIDGSVGLSKFLSGAKDIVKTKTYQYTPYYHQGYGQSPNYTPQTSGPYNPVKTDSAPTGKKSKSSVADAPKQGDNGSKTSGKKDKKSNKEEKKKSKIGDGWSGINNNGEKQEQFLDKDGNPYDATDPFGYLEGPIRVK